MSDTLTRRFAGNAALATILHFSSAFITLTVAPYALKQIGLESYGLWALLATLTRYALLADFGIGPSITRHVAQYREYGNAIAIRAATTIGALYYIAVSIPILLLAIFVAPHYLSTLHLSPQLAGTAQPSLMLFVICSLISFVFWSSQSATLSGLGNFAMCAMVNALGSVAYTVAAFVMLWLGFGMKALIYATLVQSVVSGVLGHVQLMRIDHRIYVWPWQIQRATLMEIVTFGAWSQIGTVANLLIYDSPALIVGSILGIRAVGILDIGTRLARAIRAIAFNFSGALLPAISSRHASDGEAGVLAVIPRLLRSASLIAFSATGILIACSPVILPVWLGNHVVNFGLVEIVIAGISITYTIEMLVSVLATSVRGSGMPWLEAWYTVTYAAANVLLLFILTPLFGLIGSVMASFASVTLAALVFIVRCNQEGVMPLSIWSHEGWLVKTLAAWAVATGTLFALSTVVSHLAHNRIFGLALLAALALSYIAFKVGLLILLRAVTQDDAQRLQAIFPKRIFRSSS